VSDQNLGMFQVKSTACADLKPGVLYAAAGEDDWLYYGQVTPEKNIGFFRRRDRVLTEPAIVIKAPIMSVVCVEYPSITRALRAGLWTKLGCFPLVETLIAPQPCVQWPVGTVSVIVSMGGGAEYDTQANDPAIQDMELMAVWDAEHHIPARLKADFGAEAGKWHIGGSVRREREIREEYARRFGDERPWHRLPADWVPTSI
jgi:hypothetical protein